MTVIARGELTGRINTAIGYLYFRTAGKGELPVLFAHSFAGSSRQWDSQFRSRKENQYVAFDFRDHGRSEKVTGNAFHPRSLAADILSVADHLDLKRFVLVGHSMGGSAAVAFTDAHPERVDGLVLCGTPGKTPQELSDPIIASLKSENYQQVMDQYMQKLLNGAREDVKELVMQEMRKMSKENFISVITTLFNYDPLPALKRYNGPLLIITTTREKEQANTLASQMPDAETQVIEGTSHWPQLDQAGAFNAILDDFLISLKKNDSM
mgnify:CR=1 FL=1